jgi:hypothetical protein
MILDSSPLVAILAEEPDAELYTRAAILFGRAFEHAVAPLFRREDPAAVLLEQWGVCKNMGLTYAAYKSTELNRCDPTCTNLTIELLQFYYSSVEKPRTETPEDRRF